MKAEKNPVKISPLFFGITIVLSVILTSFRISPAQTNDDPLSGWNKGVLKEANTAADVTYLPDDEKQFIFYTNLCRLQPKLFCQTVLADYLKSHTEEKAVVSSLIKQLNENKACGALVPDEELCTVAHDYARKMGEEGKEGHIDFQKRMKPIMSRYMTVGENCDYGNSLPFDAFMNLLIDSSDPVELGHRKNILNPGFKVVGVSKQPHKTFRWNYVMDFAG